MESPSPAPERLFAEFRRTGDPRALGRLYDELAPELLRLALRLARDAAEAEDVLQATFVAAIEQAGRFEEGRRVLPWLVGILGHEARKARARAARRPDPARLAPGPVDDPADAAERAELRAHLDAGLARVPAAFRPVLVLHLCHGLTVTEIAAALGRSPGTVRSQLARGSEQLRRTLPAGLARALVALEAPTRGLEAVRAAVVEEAALHGSLTVGSQTAVTALGGLAMKKLLVLAAALAGGVLLWNVARTGREPALARTDPPQPVPAALAAPLEEAPPAPATPLAARTAAPVAPAPAASSPAPAPSGAALRVHARWADGTPVAGEVVLVATRDARTDESRALTTGSDGSVRLEDLPPGPVRVRLLRGAEASATLRTGRETEVTLELRSGVIVAGRVRDGDGAPVPGAEIWVSERYRNNLGHVLTRSDEEGAFALDALGADHYVGARKPGFAPSGLRSVRGAPGDRLGLELLLVEAGAALSGTVVDRAGQPVPEAWVLVGSERPASVRLEDGSFAPAAPPQRAQADAEGRFELPAVALGLQPFQARAPGFAPSTDTFEVLPGGARDLRVVLEREARLVGRVQDPSGRPLFGVQVRIGEPELFASPWTFSGLDGSFELASIPAGRQLVEASHAEHGTARRELLFAPGEREEWQAVLAPEDRIVGRLVDAHGRPLAGLVVIAVAEDERDLRTRSDASDAEGRFAVSGLADRAHLVWVQAPQGWRDFPLAEAQGVRPGDAPLELRVAAEDERGRLQLEVAAPDGTPLPGAELHVWHVEQRLWRSFASGGESAAIRAEHVPPGSLQLELRHPEHPWKALGTQRVEAGATLDLGRIALEPSGRLRVRLLGLPEERHATLRATLVDAANRESGVPRLAPGLLTAGPLAPGEHELVLGGEGVREVRARFAITAGAETELTVTLEPCGTRVVRFAWPESSLAPAWIACTLHDAAGQRVWGGNADVAQEPPLVRVAAPPGSYRLVAGGAGNLYGELELELPPLGLALPPLELVLAPR